MDARSMVIEQIEAKIESLALAGRAIRNGQVITMDDEVIEPDDERCTMTGHQYAADLVLEVFGNDEGAQFALVIGGPYICAQHILDLDVWYLIGRSSTYRRTKTLDPNDETHADAIVALHWLIDYHQGDIPHVG